MLFFNIGYSLCVFKMYYIERAKHPKKKKYLPRKENYNSMDNVKVSFKKRERDEFRCMTNPRNILAPQQFKC